MASSLDGGRDVRRLARFLAALLNYLRLEARELGQSVVRVAWAILMLIVASMLLFLGLGFVVAAAYFAAETVLVRPLAALVAAGVALILAAIVLAYARRQTRR